MLNAPIFRLIRLAYGDRAEAALNEEEANALIARRDFHEFAPQIYFQLQRRGRLGSQPNVLQEALWHHKQATGTNNLFIRHETKRLLQCFNQLHINAILLKGPFLAERYFGHLAARPSQDIDLLIDLDDKAKAIQAAESIGYIMERAQEREHPYHVSMHRKDPSSGSSITLELHWNVIRPDTSSVNLDRIWRRSMPIPDYVCIRHWNRNDTLYLLILHATNHRLAGWKHIIDILQLQSLIGNESEQTILAYSYEDDTHRRVKTSFRLVDRIMNGKHGKGSSFFINWMCSRLSNDPINLCSYYFYSFIFDFFTLDRWYYKLMYMIGYIRMGWTGKKHVGE